MVQRPLAPLADAAAVTGDDRAGSRSGPRDLTPRSGLFPRDAKLLLALPIIGVVGFGATSDSEAAMLIVQWIYPALMLAAAGVVAAGAWSRPTERWAWGLIAAGMALPAVNGVLGPFLGRLDSLRPLWLCCYPLILAGLAILLRLRLRRLPLALGADAVIAGLAMAAIAAIAFGPYRAATSGDPVTVALSLAFPVGDLLLVAVAAGGLSMVGWGSDRRWAMLFIGFAISAPANILYMFDFASGTYHQGSWPEALRPLAAM